MNQRQTQSGIFEFVFGAPANEANELLRFWEILGFEPEQEGQLSAAEAGVGYSHKQALTSIRLRHPGCSSYRTGLVRLQLWNRLRDEGMGNAPPITVGSRWMGLYTRDVLQVRDSFTSPAMQKQWDLWTSPLVHAPLMQPPPEVTLEQPFVGLREQLVFGRRFRLAFIQRAGFDRPGFGTFADNLPFSNTEGSHGNVVQPDNAFNSQFYKTAFDFETAPFGDAHDSGSEPPTIAALSLREGETFHIERTRSVDCPSGILQIYSPYLAGDDQRHLSAPGSGNLCAYSVQVRSLDTLKAHVDTTPGARTVAAFRDEFGADCLHFLAPDGYAWLATEVSG